MTHAQQNATIAACLAGARLQPPPPVPQELILKSKTAYEAAIGRPITTEVRAASDFPELFYYAED